MNTLNIQEEILTFEIYQRSGFIFISLPIVNLEPQKFQLIENTFYIHLDSKTFIIQNISDRLIRYIQDGKAIILENLDNFNHKVHLIKLEKL